ncbi:MULTISPECIES: peptide ligase PGM1-related protein [unclassified Coleofasciculus]|uniref:peptide ligase PGM1-related protein n=1 Tax=unclassified Coleofasciculus TaxID=2692782 RepID=UPI00187FA7E7|nr:MULTISPECIES: peptide ligase PGM1-related protein [unclassified Coleofasciculus]MBE9129872.1 carboxylate-amine ligase [Coleofasciculus sp. LEGE 07081]MBE9152326.1 carboxylate-amine ligase [Coleofasciculus sp. LEGE 07092]
MHRFNQPSSTQAEQFRQLQSQLRDRWQSVDLFDQDDHDILVVPSVSVDQRELGKIAGFLHYEERLLFSLIRLRNPRTRLIYVTAQPLSPIIIDYYLQLLPGIPFSHARERLLLMTPYDSSRKPLSQKILERPRLMHRIRQALRPKKSYMVCYNSTNLERELSVQLGIPLLAPDPDLLYWGTKSGSRDIFKRSGVPCPDGSESIWTVKDLIEGAAELWERQPSLKRMVIKLNEGFSGEGNALLDLKPILDVAPGQASHEQRVTALSDRLEHLRFQAKSETWAHFSSRIPELGAIVEAFIEGDEKRSPSVQGYITPNGEVKILSTHDQVLGGPDDQIYLGCRFPADEAYRLRLQNLGMRIGKILAKKGAIERYGVDFIAVHQPDNTSQPWDLQAIEINLRKGGTTHPFMTLKYLTNGRYDLSTGLFYSQQGREKYYIATDNLQKERYRGLMPNDLMDIITHHRLHFDSSTRTGSVFHLMGALSEFGKLGLTCIGDSMQQAEEFYNQVVQVLDEETNPNTNSDDSLSYPSLPMGWSISEYCND